MKTTIELPDDLFREAKALAARRGESLKDFVREALEEKLARQSILIQPTTIDQWPVPPPDVPIEELRKIDAFIEEAFEQVDDEDQP